MTAKCEWPCREIANNLGFPEGPVAMNDGSVILVEIARGTLTRITCDGRSQVIAYMGGGPNGAAIGPDGAMYVCNNGGFLFRKEADGSLRPIGQPPDYSGGRIERVEIDTGRVEKLYSTIKNRDLSGPNDLIFDRSGNFYFTDLGKIREFDMDRGAIYYACPSGDKIVAVVGSTVTPNGIALSPNEDVLYYAETEGARIWAFSVEECGRLRKEPWPSPHGGSMITAAPGGYYQRFDSMAVDILGNLYIGTLIRGGITVISPQGTLLTYIPMPDRYSTNLCFGGPENRTIFVTLSSTGRLVAIDDWPIPGLKPNFN